MNQFKFFNRPLKGVISLLALLILVSCNTDAQTECEKIFMQSMQKVEKEIKAQKLSAADAEAYVLAQNDKLKAKYPDCFPHSHDELAEVAPTAKKIDSQNMSDQEIQQFNQDYQKRSKECKTELMKATAQLSKSEAEKLIHECTLEKIVASKN